MQRSASERRHLKSDFDLHNGGVIVGAGHDRGMCSGGIGVGPREYLNRVVRFVFLNSKLILARLAGRLLKGVHTYTVIDGCCGGLIRCSINSNHHGPYRRRPNILRLRIRSEPEIRISQDEDDARRHTHV